MAITRYFHHETLEEVHGITNPIMQVAPAWHAVVQQDDGTFSSGIFHGYATPHQAIAAHQADLEAAYARIRAKPAAKEPVGYCHYCGQGVYDKRTAVFALGVYQCRECQ